MDHKCARIAKYVLPLTSAVITHQDTYHCCQDLPPGAKLVFRVSCGNKCGWSLPGNESDVIVTESQSEADSHSLSRSPSIVNGGEKRSSDRLARPGLDGPRPRSMIGEH